MQVLVEVAGDAGEDHGLGMHQVNEELRGGGRVHQTHAPHGHGDVEFLPRIGRQRAPGDAEARTLGHGHVVKRVRDVCGLLVEGGNDGDGLHGSPSRQAHTAIDIT